MQGHVAYYLDVDFPMLSHVERGERKAMREWIPKLAHLLKVNEEDYLIFSYADRILELVEDGKVAIDSNKKSI